MPLRWIYEEAAKAGLRLNVLDSDVTKDLPRLPPTGSSSFFLKCLDFLPLKRLTYTDATTVTL